MALRAVVLVSNDLVTDRRVDRVCQFLTEKEVNVLLVGRKIPGGLPMDERNYASKRVWLPFSKGALFYAALNIRFFWLLLFRRYDFVVANDLDTLWAARWGTRIRRKPMIYDTHEYFTHMAELMDRPRVQRFWKRIEDRHFPKLKHVYTVNRSIADIYEKEYGVRLGVVRNIADVPQIPERSRAELGLPSEKKIIILQGAGINIDRGGEEAVGAMQSVDALLLVIGKGTAIPLMKRMVEELGLQDKVLFRDPMPYPEMMAHTQHAAIGLSLDKPLNLNYKFSLPNKIFDYIHAGVPIVASDLPEVGRIVKGEKVGITIAEVTSQAVSTAVNALLNDEATWKTHRENCRRASQTLTWEKEKAALEEIYRPLLEDCS